MFLNGPIGVQVGPHGPVWEVSDEFPIEGRCRATACRTRLMPAPVHGSHPLVPGLVCGNRAPGGLAPFTPGDGGEAPPGAELLPRNFRKALLVGRELANAVVKLLNGPRAQPVAPTTFDVRTAAEYTFLSNPLFRFGKRPHPHGFVPPWPPPPPPPPLTPSPS